MDSSVFLAKVFGLYLVIVSIPLIFNYQYIQRVVATYVDATALVFITSIITLILGILLILTHNIWVWEWPVIITVLSWATFIKGVMWLYAPELGKQFALKVNTRNAYWLSAGISILVGVYLLYVSYAFT